MTFVHGDYLLWLFLVLFSIVIYIIRHYHREKKLKQWFGLQKKFLIQKISYKSRHLKQLLVCLALSLFILALARPQTVGDKRELQSLGIQIILAVDVSRSMLTEDVKPSRLGFLKKEMSLLLDSLSGHQISLMAFSSSAVRITPFTNDISLVKRYLRDLSPDYLSSQGTDFKSIFSLAEKTFQGVKVRRNQKSLRAILIASDGEDHGTATNEAFKKMIQEGVRIFTLAFGTKEGGAIPVKNDQGEVLEYKKDSAGRVVVSQLQTQTLKQLSQKGNGAYYHVTYSSNALKKMQKDLNQLEKTFFQSGSFYKKREWFQWFLFFGLVLALVELAISDRKKKRKF